jgi:transposase
MCIFWDNASTHRAEAVKDFVEANKDRLMTIESVPYKPQFNGIEYVWSILKQNYRNRLLLRKLDNLRIDNKAIIEECLNELRN